MLRGTVKIQEIEFPSLQGNPLRDPDIRPTVVYLPPNYRKEIPCVIALAGFTGTSLGFLNHDPFSPNLIEQADALIRKGLPPFMIAIPDGFTRYGGSQYVNSSATGRYEDMVIKDFVPWVRKNYRVSSFAILGKSSGGYGALHLGMKHPEIFSGIACHSGDLYFEWVYKHDFPEAAQHLENYKSVQDFVKSIWKKKKRSSKDIVTLNIVAMAACYSSGELPFDLKTGRMRDDIWKKWLRFDPINLIEKYSQNLKRLKAFYLDCGTQDEFFLHFGARIFSNVLKQKNIPYHYEEFPDGHRNIGYRYSASLPYLMRRL